MPWYCYLACFFAGAFLANAVPHFVKGITGQPFPTPFAKTGVSVNRSSFTGWKSPGTGLSSPAVNVLWGLLNLIIGVALFRASQFQHRPPPSALLVFFAGMALMSIQLSYWFGKQHPR